MELVVSDFGAETHAHEHDDPGDGTGRAFGVFSRLHSRFPPHRQRQPRIVTLRCNLDCHLPVRPMGRSVSPQSGHAGRRLDAHLQAAQLGLEVQLTHEAAKRPLGLFNQTINDACNAMLFIEIGDRLPTTIAVHQRLNFMLFNSAL